jgi:hypothetical protein
MEKLNYQIAFYAEDEIEAYEQLKKFLLRNFPPYYRVKLLEAEEVIETEIDKFFEELYGGLNKQKPKETEVPKETEKEKFLKDLMEFEKVIQIIGKCLSDETTIDRIAKMIGINVKPETTQP